ncbi:hypothetical protein [Streptomyces sp. SID3212]|uniref:hypothetical protein n=1 Tax=Streptomyces sp. SID3212 TaxID=2690259 RepID=UPI0013689071|nr:hypothetical protein [Streptomyces sp. SID3212]MYV56525.1 hypothetical protein [Streptomyces sp. SID3212]
MVATPSARDETLAEIAVRHGRDYETVRGQWARQAVWPPATGKRGKWKLYDSATVDAVIARHFVRDTGSLEPRRLYTAKEIEAATGISAGTIRTDRTKLRADGTPRWPAPDDTSEKAHRWYGDTITTELKKRRKYKRSAPKK